ncbi:MAG: Lysine/ornithine decarboxylase [Alphaproteobacteria bacterium MarineAlpha9_Bin4]|nr:MAG: Lysine/ornithine decarboxylase [Alphaproteobacteria bacterium MarineAlpha9_Bin4]
MSNNCLQWLDTNKPQSPALVFDLSMVEKNYIKLKYLLKDIEVFYAVKANPNKKILELLNNLGSSFDCASLEEISFCLNSKVSAKKISYGSTLKKETDIEKAFSLGVRLYAFDSLEELEKIARNAPGAQVFCRLMVPNGGAEWPLSKKFGCNYKVAEKLIIIAKNKGLNPIGVSFHVGSQQLSEKTWTNAINIASKVFKKLAQKNIMLNFLNLGGGIPAKYTKSSISNKNYLSNILKSISKSFGNLKPGKIIIEPGRFLVANAGIIETEVILVTNRGQKNGKKWVYIDVGRYNGLAETEGEAIHYEIRAKGYKKFKKEKFILAGPSCDSHDVIYETKNCFLPSKLKSGDKLRILSSGAYTTVYSSEFNGLKKISEYFIK